MAINSYGEHFYQNKLLLDPTEASFLDLILFLVSSNIKGRGFIECHEEQGLRNFNSRWIVVISVLVQKILLFFRKPMAMIGNALEMWLNLLLCNGGFFKLLLNLLKGKVVKTPDRSSEKFTSVIGNLDLRVELDKKSSPGDKKYNASLSWMAAKLAYENGAFVESIVKDHWNMKFLGFFDFWNDHLNQASTHAFMFQDTKADPNLFVLAFRGTEPFDAYGWATDVDLSWYKFKGIGQIHRGFMKALGSQNNGWPKEIIEPDHDHLYAYYETRQMLRDIVSKNEQAKFIVTGHSLGGALAILFVAVLTMHGEAELLERLEGVYTFGQPRVGDEEFGEYMIDGLKKHKVKYLRYVYCNDMVPRVPFDNNSFFYKHFWECKYYTSWYKEKVMQEEPNKNYFSLLMAIPKFLNAVWELIRSFIIPCLKGPDYRESWLMTLIRVVGLVIPGLSAHCPQDYTNSTRLGS
ncbi:hypothetical protein Peur_022951 [Populus x canadensis]|uniref:triacylglycerol lipase OBL1-like n=1 Tax=Populus nigra TaxID=3691 RepID=UPI002B271FF6|nr:triacylglycerol lipase OBL1-like [Populus nigra]